MSVAPDAARVLAVTRVVPVPPPPAGSLAGRHHENLSFLDAPWVATPPVQQVFLYELAGGHEFPALVRRLKESLAATLALYLPLAGKLAYAAETGDVVIDCSDAGVDFFEAEAEGDVTNAPAFVTLLPEHDARVLPAPVMRVQATLVGVRGDSGAGLALGVSLHHAIADGHGMALFMGSWASACRGGSPVLTSLGPPEHSRVAVAHVHPDGEALARQVLKKVAPDLPVATVAEGYLSHRSRLAGQMFSLDADHVRLLKRRIDDLASRSAATATSNKPVSTFVALSALCWTSFVKAKGLAAGDDTHLVFQVDLRARLRPPVGVGYSGNCVRGCHASADAGELLGETGLLHASMAVQAAVAEVVTAPFAQLGNWIERVGRLPPSRVAIVGGSPLFRVYNFSDFGFGTPRRVEPLSMAGSPWLQTQHDAAGSGSGSGNGEGTIVLCGGKRDGDVQVSVSLDPKRAQAFKAHVTGDGGFRPRI